jgi:hypothetical protein
MGTVKACLLLEQQQQQYLRALMPARLHRCGGLIFRLNDSTSTNTIARAIHSRSHLL